MVETEGALAVLVEDRAIGAGGNRATGGTSFGNQANFLVGQQNGIAKTNAAGINFSDQLGKKLTVTGSYFFNNTNSLNNQVTDQQSLNSTDFIRKIVYQKIIITIIVLI